MSRPVRICLLVALGGCCHPEGDIAALAGEGAIDCGFAPLVPTAGTPTRDEVIDCAEAAVAADEAFFAGHATQGVDSEVRNYMARDASGLGWLVFWDDDGSSIRVEAWDCVGDHRRVSVTDGRGVSSTLTCDTRTVAPSRDLSCR